MIPLEPYDGPEDALMQDDNEIDINRVEFVDIEVTPKGAVPYDARST
jgi:hypothetical protein